MSNPSNLIKRDINAVIERLEELKGRQLETARTELRTHYASFVIERRRARNQPEDGSRPALMGPHAMNPYSEQYNQAASYLTKQRFDSWVRGHSENAIRYMDAINQMTSINILLAYLRACHRACCLRESSDLLDVLITENPSLYPRAAHNANPTELIPILYELMQKPIDAEKEKIALAKEQYHSDKFWASFCTYSSFAVAPVALLAMIALIIEVISLPIGLPIVIALIASTIALASYGLVLNNQTACSPSDTGMLSDLSDKQRQTNFASEYYDAEVDIMKMVYDSYDIPLKSGQQFRLLSETPDYFTSLSHTNGAYHGKKVVDFATRVSFTEDQASIHSAPVLQ